VAEVWRKVEKEREKLRNKKSWKSTINIIFKNNAKIRILAIELLNTILLLAFY
jgi:ribosomal protein L32E